MSITIKEKRMSKTSFELNEDFSTTTKIITNKKEINEQFIHRLSIY